MSAPNICDTCAAQFYYDPKSHRCPGEWEAITGEASPANPGTTWVEECMAKQYGSAS